MEPTYIPGVCNIGPAELLTKKQEGWIGLACSGIFFILAITLHIPALWRIVIFLPIMMSILGFIQAKYHFCVHYGFQGISNMSFVPGKTKKIEVLEYQVQDKEKAGLIFSGSILVGIILTAITVFI